MPATWKTVRVFISSTFRDMHAERDHLVKVVFPALRERLEKYCVHLIDIDLRWGVTKEQADNDQALDVCLDQIDACRPFFIGILGERYGWVSTKLPERVASKYGWVRHHTGKSITELEILYSVLQNPQMRRHAFFYFRDPDALLAVPETIRRTVYYETEPELIAKLHDLKEQIRRSGFPLLDGYPARWDPETYDRPSRSQGRLVGLEAFSKRVREQLWQAIQEELQLPEQPPGVTAADPLAEEQDYHDRFMESRLRVYVGREQINDTLLAFAHGNDLVPCLVTGPSGSGKSAALARFVREYQHKQPQTFVLPHFIGASPRSTNLRDMLRRFCQVFKARFGFAEEVPEGAAKLSVTFREFVGKVSANTRVLLVIDALNQMDEGVRAQELYWLPAELPPQVKVIVSCITDSGKMEPVLEAFRWRKHCLVQVTALSDAEQRDIIRQVPSLSAKTLDDEQVRLLLSNPATANPLFLLVALEELRGFAPYERLHERIAAFPREGDTVTAIFTQVIERLAEEFNQKLVETVLTLLASARRGLSERELQELVAGLEGADDLFPVLRQLRPYLLSRGGLIGFYHGNVSRAVETRYLAEAARTDMHLRLAAYWDAERAAVVVGNISAVGATYSLRCLDELPWQRVQARDWDGMYRLLNNFRFARDLWKYNADDFLGYQNRMETHSPHRLVDTFRELLKHPDFRGQISFYAAEVLLATAHYEEAIPILETVTRHFVRMGWRVNVAHALACWGAALFHHKDYFQAEQRCRELERLCRKINYRYGLQAALARRAAIFLEADQFAEAMNLELEVEFLARDLGDWVGLHTSLLNQAGIHARRGQTDRAAPLLEEAERLARTLGGRAKLHVTLANFALVQYQRGQAAEARRCQEEAARLEEELAEAGVPTAWQIDPGGWRREPDLGLSILIHPPEATSEALESGMDALAQHIKAQGEADRRVGRVHSPQHLVHILLGTQHDEDPELIMLEIDSYLKYGRVEDALDRLDQSPVRDPRLTNARGVCLLRQGRVADAVELFRQVTSASGPVQYQTNLATALLLAGDQAGCRVVLDRIAAPPDHWIKPTVEQLRTALGRSGRPGDSPADVPLGHLVYRNDDASEPSAPSHPNAQQSRSQRSNPSTASTNAAHQEDARRLLDRGLELVEQGRAIDAVDVLIKLVYQPGRIPMIERATAIDVVALSVALIAAGEYDRAMALASDCSGKTQPAGESVREVFRDWQTEVTWLEWLRWRIFGRLPTIKPDVARLLAQCQSEMPDGQHSRTE